MISELLACVGIVAVGIVGGAIMLLIPETRRERERRERQSNPRWETNAEAHRREIDEIDTAWCAEVDADLARVLAETAAGRDACLRKWDASVAPLVPEDAVLQPGQSETVVEFRQRRRQAGLNVALRRASEARYDLVQRQERQKRYDKELQDRLLSERLDREWARDRERFEREQAERQRAEQARDRKLSRPIPLAMQPAGIVFGTKVEDGEDLVVPSGHLQHILVAGVSGSGKSVFLHQLVWQLVQMSLVRKLYIVDLKGGVEFYRYRDSSKVEIVWEFDAVAALFDSIAALMVERENEMRARGLQYWPDGRIVVVIDEYAEIQSEIDTATTREDKERAKRLAANLVRIARRARALGITLICALQKPTTDAMDSAIRTNLGCRVCFRVGSRALAASLLDDLDDAPADPVSLETGRCIYYDSARGKIMQLQVQIAPGVRAGGSA